MTTPTDTKNQDAAERLASELLDAWDVKHFGRAPVANGTRQYQSRIDLVSMIAKLYRAGQASKEPEIAELNESRKRLVQNEFEALKKRDALRATNEILSAENKKFIKFSNFINDDSELEEVKSQLASTQESLGIKAKEWAESFGDRDMLRKENERLKADVNEMTCTICDISKQLSIEREKSKKLVEIIKEIIPLLKESATVHSWSGNFLKMAVKCEFAVANYASPAENNEKRGENG